MGEISSIGRRIKIARIQSGLKQDELGREIGKDRNYMSKIERGIREIPAEILKKIADALKLPLSYFHETGEPFSTNDEIVKRVIEKLKKNGYVINKKSETDIDLSTDMIDLIQALKKDRAFFEYCKVVMGISKYPYIIDHATKFMEGFIEIINGVERRTEERVKTAGKSNF